MEKEILELLKEIRNDLDGLKKDASSQLQIINNKLDNLEMGQEEIKALIVELDPKNANRHLEINEKLDNLIEENKSIREILGEHEVSIRTLRRKII